MRPSRRSRSRPVPSAAIRRSARARSGFFQSWDSRSGAPPGIKSADVAGNFRRRLPSTSISWASGSDTKNPPRRARSTEPTIPARGASRACGVPRRGRPRSRARRRRAPRARAVVGPAVGAEEHVAGRRRGRRLAEVERVFWGSDPANQESAATDVPRLRERDGERERGRDRRVDRIPTFPQDLRADLARARVVAHHHSAGRGDTRGGARGGRRGGGILGLGRGAGRDGKKRKPMSRAGRIIGAV